MNYNNNIRYNDDVKAIAVHGKHDMETIRFRLLTATDTDVKSLFSATFATLKGMQEMGYSQDAQKPYKIGLLETLVELRVRRMEVDYNGNIYHPSVFHPVPKIFAQALKRQVNKLRYMDAGYRHHLCHKTLAAAKQNATRFGKSVDVEGVH